MSQIQLPEPHDIEGFNLAELVQLHEEIKVVQETLDGAMGVVKERLLLEIPDNGTVINDYAVTKRVVTSYKTTLAQAEELGATKVKSETVVDLDFLKALDKKGVEVPGKTVNIYPSIKRVKQEGEGA